MTRKPLSHVRILIYRTWATFTLTKAAIPCESCLTTAIKVSSGIYTNCMLMAIMAAVDAFIDIWITQGAKKQKKMNFSFFFHWADQWPFRVNNGLQSLLLKCLTCSFFLVDGCCKMANEALAPPQLFPKERQLWRVSLEPFSRKLLGVPPLVKNNVPRSLHHAKCILVAIMAAAAAFIDIWSASNRRKTRKK